MQTSLFIKDCEAFKFSVPPLMLAFFHQLFLHHMQVGQKVKQLLIITTTYAVQIFRQFCKWHISLDTSSFYLDSKLKP